MRVVGIVITLFALAACGSQKAANDQSVGEAPFECGKRPNDVEVASCLEAEVQKSSARVQKALQRNYREAATQDKERAIFEGQPSTIDPNTHLNALKASQAVWEKYVGAHCTLESYIALGGTAEHHYKLWCHDRMNLQRLKDLRSPLILESQRLQPVPEE